MGQRTKGDMWCDFCDVPVLGTKTTHRLRGAVIGATLIPTQFASAAFSRVEGYRCPNCGQRVRRATRGDFDRLAQRARSERAADAQPDVAVVEKQVEPAKTEQPRKSPEARKRELRYLVDSRPNGGYKVSLVGLLRTFVPGRPDTLRSRERLTAELESAGLYIAEDLAAAGGTVTLCTRPPEIPSRVSDEPLSLDVLEQLRELDEFREAGKVSEAEYEAIRHRLLEA